jgi:hypothetical protein
MDKRQKAETRKRKSVCANLRNQRENNPNMSARICQKTLSELCEKLSELCGYQNLSLGYYQEILM